MAMLEGSTVRTKEALPFSFQLLTPTLLYTASIKLLAQNSNPYLLQHFLQLLVRFASLPLLLIPPTYEFQPFGVLFSANTARWLRLKVSQ